MAPPISFALGLVGVATLLTVFAGCAGTISKPGAADGSVITPDAQSNAPTEDSGPAARIDASVKLVQASDYDQSCTINSDCVEIYVGNGSSCEITCGASPAAINKSAEAQYLTDVRNLPPISCACEVTPPVAVEGGPCCIGGSCQFTQCPNLVTTGDAAADAGTSDAALESSSATSLQCGAGTFSGAGTDQCINAGGVCVQVPDPACCDLVPGFDPTNSGCPHAPFAIRCCALDGSAGATDASAE